MTTIDEMVDALNTIRHFCNEHDSCDVCKLHKWCMEYVHDTWLDYRANDAINVLLRGSLR